MHPNRGGQKLGIGVFTTLIDDFVGSILSRSLLAHVALLFSSSFAKMACLLSAAASSNAGASVHNMRALLQGAPSPLAALAAQRANLERFLLARADAFAALRYIPWTTPPLQPAPGTTMRASTLSAAHLGVYPSEQRRSAAPTTTSSLWPTV